MLLHLSLSHLVHGVGGLDIVCLVIGPYQGGWVCLVTSPFWRICLVTGLFWGGGVFLVQGPFWVGGKVHSPVLTSSGGHQSRLYASYWNALFYDLIHVILIGRFFSKSPCGHRKSVCDYVIRQLSKTFRDDRFKYSQVP